MMHIHTSQESKYSYIFLRINNRNAIKVGFIILVCVLISNICYFYKFDDFVAIWLLIKSKLISLLKPEKIFKLNIANKEYSILYAQYSEYFNKVLFDFHGYKFKAESILFWLPYQFLLVVIFLFSFFRLSSFFPVKEHLSGKKIISEKELKKQIKNHKGSIPIGPFTIPIVHETKHVFFSGNPVYGKNIFLDSVIDEIIRRNDQAIIYDFDGKYISKFYRSKLDYIFNPFDNRCIRWNIFSELLFDQDVNFLAASIVPRNIEHYNESALIIAAMLRHLIKNNKKNHDDLLNLASLEIKAIADLIKEPAILKISKEYQIDKLVQIQKIILKSLNVLNSFKETEDNFSIAEWIDNKKGNIYISDVNSNSQISSFFINLLIHFTHKKLHEDINRRVFLLCDNFENLDKQSWLGTVLYNGSEKGLSLWIGITKNFTMKRNYGEGAVKNIISYCGCNVFFKPHDSEMAKLISESSGKNKIRLLSGKSTTSSDYFQDHYREITDNVISEESLMCLKEFQAYITFSGAHFSKVCIQNKAYPSVNKNFIFDQKNRLTASLESVLEIKKADTTLKNISKVALETSNNIHDSLPENENIKIEIDKKLDNQVVRLE